MKHINRVMMVTAELITVPTFEAWTLGQKLTAGDGTVSDEFGFSVNLSNDGKTAIVGAWSDDNSRGGNAGSAYIFTRTGDVWTQQARLSPADGSPGSYFGYAVSISADGNTALIGAHGDGADGGGKGTAYIFIRTGVTWTQQVRFSPTDLTLWNYFGHCVAISGDGDTALIGSTYDDSQGTDSGAAYVFKRTGVTWTQQAKLKAVAGGVNDYFAQAVSLSFDGSTALIGMDGSDTKAPDAGAAFIFTRTGITWTQQSKFFATDFAAYELFGRSVSISSSGDVALIGAQTASNKGAAYVFTRTGVTWTQQAKLIAGDGAVGDAFSTSVSLSGNGTIAVVGTPKDIDPVKGSNVGSVYVFTKTGSSWIQKIKLVPADGQTGDQFGWSVSASEDGSVFLAGAHLDDDRGSNAGSLYVYNGV